MRRLKVLLVDDEYMILAGLKLIIDWNSLGFEVVHTAKTAFEALDFLADNEIDLLITDITMPEMDGIELIRQAQRRQNQFYTIILSGYQEFNYVKQGLDLGVKAYLVKPVNKIELQEVVLEIKEDILEMETRIKLEESYKESLLFRWLNDDLNEVEYFELMKLYGNKSGGHFTPLLFSGATEDLEKVQSFFKKKGQVMELSTSLEEHEYILVYHGTRQRLLVSIRELEAIVPGTWQVFTGETIVAWETLYRSFSKIKQLQNLRVFYPDLNLNGKFLPTSIADDENEKLLFLSFNEALMIGDLNTIQEELEVIFTQLLMLQIDPDRVKSIAFLLFIDIYRQFPSLSQNYYEEINYSLRQTKTVIDLKNLLIEVLAKAKAEGKAETKRYSLTVQEIIAFISERYREEISLKLVAEKLHLSTVYLGQLFKKETDLSFNQYLNQIRIKKAQELLLSSQQTVSEIADSIGYNNANYFSKMFKKLNGLTPKEFRDAYYEKYDSIS